MASVVNRRAPAADEHPATKRPHHDVPSTKDVMVNHERSKGCAHVQNTIYWIWALILGVKMGSQNPLVKTNWVVIRWAVGSPALLCSHMGSGSSSPLGHPQYVVPNLVMVLSARISSLSPL